MGRKKHGQSDDAGEVSEELHALGHQPEGLTQALKNAGDEEDAHQRYSRFQGTKTDRATRRRAGQELARKYRSR